MARDDDIFKKLKKETPLVKRKDLQPLTSRDFGKKSKFDIKIEKQAEKRRVSSKAVPSGDLNAFSRTTQKQQPSRQNIVPSRRSEAKPPEVRRREPAAQHEIEAFGRLKEPARPHDETDSVRTQASEREAGRSTSFVHESKQEDAARVPRKSFSLNGIKASGTHQELQVFPGSSKSVRSVHIPSDVQLIDPDEVALAEEPANSAMTFRHELKYYIDYRDYMLLRNTLKALLPLDRFSGPNGEYHIRSLYFDDIYETALKEKVAGNDIRNKYRIRIYNFSDDNIKFEKKMKQGQFIAKESIRLDRDECERLLAGDFGALEGRREPLASEIYLQMKNNCLRPRVTVDYLREAYVSAIENVRVTFDKDLKAGLWATDIFNAHAPTMPIFDNGTMVLEVKFNKHMPQHIKGVLNTVNAAQRCAISKYVLCRWHN